MWKWISTPVQRNVLVILCGWLFPACRNEIGFLEDAQKLCAAWRFEGSVLRLQHSLVCVLFRVNHRSREPFLDLAGTIYGFYGFDHFRVFLSAVCEFVPQCRFTICQSSNCFSGAANFPRTAWICATVTDVDFWLGCFCQQRKNLFICSVRCLRKLLFYVAAHQRQLMEHVAVCGHVWYKRFFGCKMDIGTLIPLTFVIMISAKAR